MTTPTHYTIYDPLPGSTFKIRVPFEPPPKSLKEAKKRIEKANAKAEKGNSLTRVRLEP